MLASERSLTSAHESQQHRQQSGVQGLGRYGNGVGKPGTRPVKIYVIDPRKLQQRLEAYVGQKKQAQAENGKVHNNGDTGDQTGDVLCEKVSPEMVSTTSITPVNNSITSIQPKPKTTTANNVKHTRKVLPVLAPKLPAAPTKNHTPIPVNQDATRGHSVALQCISSAGYGLPVVVTNGVALIQQPSIPTSGMFLPGVATIPNGFNATSIIGATTNQNQSKTTPQKRKAKKKKVSKKRKTTDEKETEDEEAELAYLLKETTTRTGRISRPVSQPNSPAFASLPTTKTSITSPKRTVARNLKSKKINPADVDEVFICQTCLKPFLSSAKLETHLEKFPQHRTNNDFESRFQKSTNDQGIVTVQVTAKAAASSVTETKIVPPTVSLEIETCKTSSIYSSPITSQIRTPKRAKISKKPKKRATNSNIDNNSSSCKRISTSSNVSENLLPTNHLTQNRPNGHNSDSSIQTTKASLVPRSVVTDEPSEMFSRCMTSKVVEVPTSYSIPSSPPSQCQSPGLPENSTILYIPRKESSNTERVCNSPVDPMLLHSRSPFPSQIPETSQHSVGASNLSIPEESLCKGELFMDLGDGILGNLENADMNRASPYCSEASNGQLFSDSPRTLQKREERESHIDDTPPLDNDSSVTTHSSSKHVAPMLLETTEDANDGEIFQTANYARNFVHPSTLVTLHTDNNSAQVRADTDSNSNVADIPKTPQSTCVESDLSMDSTETSEHVHNNHKRRSVWQYVKEQIKLCGISQACGEISEMADKLSRVARDQFIPIREEEIERLGNSASVIHVDSPFFSHLLDLPFGTYIFKEDYGKRKKLTPPPPVTSELSFTGGVEDVEQFLPPDIDLISLPHLTNLDLN